jgi:hypothetical protein
MVLIVSSYPDYHAARTARHNRRRTVSYTMARVALFRFLTAEGLLPRGEGETSG